MARPGRLVTITSRSVANIESLKTFQMNHHNNYNMTHES